MLVGAAEGQAMVGTNGYRRLVAAHDNSAWKGSVTWRDGRQGMAGQYRRMAGYGTTLRDHYGGMGLEQKARSLLYHSDVSCWDDHKLEKDMGEKKKR